MTRAWNAERAAEREQAALDQAYADGEISDADYRAQSRQIERDMHDAYQADLDDAAERVRDDWGMW